MPVAQSSIAALSDLAYRHASTALAEQQQALEGIRGRVGTLLASGTISTSFLGGQALRSGGLHLASWLAIGCFVALGIVTFMTLWPTRKLASRRVDPRHE
jgi:hypothetical protein